MYAFFIYFNKIAVNNNAIKVDNNGNIKIKKLYKMNGFMHSKIGMKTPTTWSWTLAHTKPKTHRERERMYE